MNGNLYIKALLLMIVSVVCQCVNLARDILMARSFGTSYINDVYLVSQTIVSIIVTMINSPMATAYVPVAIKFWTGNDILKKNQFISTIYSDTAAVALALTTIEILFIRVIVRIAAPGFDPAYSALLIKLVLIQAPITFINIIRGVNRGNLQILQSYAFCEVTHIFPYICMCLYLLLPVRKDIVSIAVILSACNVAAAIPEWIVLYRHGLRFRFSFAINSDVKLIVKMMAAGAITAGIREINILFDKSIGSLLPTGSITMLSYASKLSVVVVGLISSSVSLVGFTNAAKLRSEGNEKKVLDNLVDSLNLINFFVIPVSVYLFVFSDDIIRILYYGGNFDMQSVKTTANLMRLYSIGLAAYGFQDVFSRTLHACKIVRSSMKASFIMVCLNIILNLCSYRYLGAYGVATATSISIIAIIPIYGRDVKKYVGDFETQKIATELLAVYGVSIITGVVGTVIRQASGAVSMPIFLAESVACLLVFLLLCFLTRNATFLKVIMELRWMK